MRNLLSVFVTMAVLVPACQHREELQRSNVDPYATAPLHTSYQITVRFQDSSFTRAVLTAGVAIVNEDRKETMLGSHVHVVFHDRKSGKAAAWLDADSAVIDDRSKDMTAIGNVRVWSDSSNTQLETTRLVWDQKSERIRTSEPVRITTPTEVIDGVGLVSDQMLTDYRIFNVRGVHQP